MTEPCTVGQKLTQLMQEKQITDYALSKKTGLSRAYIGSIKRDDACPSLVTVERLAEGLGVDASLFLSANRSLQGTEVATAGGDR